MFWFHTCLLQNAVEVASILPLNLYQLCKHAVHAVANWSQFTDLKTYWICRRIDNEFDSYDVGYHCHV
uniref:Secreted protein n=1 Tax=Panagrellus redivivus TaxID=6233 RepID=A0A7E4VT33_PANRE